MLAEPLPKRIRYTRMALDKGQISGVINSQSLERLATALLENGLTDQGPLPNITVGMKFESNGVDAVKALGDATFDYQWCCQRCLEPVSLTIAVDVDVVLSAQASVIEQLDFDQDSLLLEGEHISVAELIEDQLLLALPMSPKHWECRGLSSETDAEMDRDAPSSKLNEREGDIAEGRQRPFADLKAITKKID